MKTTIRLPLGQFEFIEQTFEENITAEMAVNAFNDLKEAYKASQNAQNEPTGAGIPQKEYNLIYDQLLNTGSVIGDPSVIGEHMSREQKTALNELKKAIKRLKAKSGEQEIEQD